MSWPPKRVMLSSFAVMLDRGRFAETGARLTLPSRPTEPVGIDGTRIDRVHLHAVALADVGQRLHECVLRTDHR